MAARAGIEPVLGFLQACVETMGSEIGKPGDAQLRTQGLARLMKIIIAWRKISGELRTAMQAMTHSAAG